jgi:hypothetical protein
MFDRTRSGLLGAVLASAACAQSTYVIDRLNRPGTNFLDLPAAEAAALDGDTLILRSDASPYTTVTTSKALTILGDPSGIASFQATGPAMLIQNVAAGRDFVLRNCQFSTFGTTGSQPLVIAACLGRVHLQEVEATTYVGAPGIEIYASGYVTLRNCKATGTPALKAQFGAIEVMDSQFTGTAASALTALPASPGIRLDGTVANLCNVACQGGLAAGNLPPAEAMNALSSVVRATGIGVVPRFTAGSYGSSGLATPVSAVAGSNSQITLDPTVALSPRGGAPGVATSLAVIAQAQPALSVTGYSIFGVQFQGGVGAAQVTLIGFPSDRQFLPGIGGQLWIDSTAMFVAPGVLGGFGGFTESMLPGHVTLVLQIAELQGGAVNLTLPAVVTSRL